MGKFKNMLSKRLEKKPPSTKASALAKRSAEGQLTGFSGVFGLTEITPEEKSSLQEILAKYAPSGILSFEDDLKNLLTLTAEVRAITNQAAILHGERIKKAQTILKNYRDGAFTAWLLNTYGNRQTPYNFLQYYDFYQAMPRELHAQIEAMPRQAVYTLASRHAPSKEKEFLVQNYNGETKSQLIALIRQKFPLGERDQRQSDPSQKVLQGLNNVKTILEKSSSSFDQTSKNNIRQLIRDVDALLD
ncbi:MAG: CT583 family protein [Chlamydiota bacterium]